MQTTAHQTANAIAGKNTEITQASVDIFMCPPETNMFIIAGLSLLFVIFPGAIFFVEFEVTKGIKAIYTSTKESTIGFYRLLTGQSAENTDSAEQQEQTEFNNINKENTASEYEKDDPGEHEEYIKEQIRLVEALISDLMSIIASIEKKSYAVIAGAVAILTFLATQQWCFDVSDLLRGLSMVFCLLTILTAGFVVSPAYIGILGAYPDEITELGENIEKQVSGKTAEYRGKSRINLLRYGILSNQYYEAVAASEKNYNEKEEKFTIVKYSVVMAFFSAVAWLCARIFAAI